MKNKNFNELEHLISKFVDNFEGSDSEEVGEVVSVRDCIAIVLGLNNLELEEVVVFDSGARGITLALDVDVIKILIIDHEKKIKSGDIVRRTKKFLTVNVSEKMIGSILNGYGLEINSNLSFGEEVLVESSPTPILHRKNIDQQLFTGVKSIDWFNPVGYGQKQLIAGEKSKGKSSILKTIISNLKNEKDVVSIYLSIGQKISDFVLFQEQMNKEGVCNLISMVVRASDEPGMTYISPFVAVAIGEYFMKKGKKAVVFLDNLSTHARSYRHICLSMDRPPGREAFPSDIFYLHARLLERAACLNSANGGGSLTIFPVVETLGKDVSEYVTTNVISITDGQIIVSKKLFIQDYKPAIDLGLSVSRVGSSTQHPKIKNLCSKIKRQIFSDSIDNMNNNGPNPIEKSILQQGTIDPVSFWHQVILLNLLKRLCSIGNLNQK